MPLLHCISGKGVFTAFLGSLRHFNFSHSYLFLIFFFLSLFIFLYLGGPGRPHQQQYPGYPPAFQQPYPETYPQPQGFSAPYPNAQQNTPYPPSGFPGQPRGVTKWVSL